MTRKVHLYLKFIATNKDFVDQLTVTSLDVMYSNFASAHKSYEDGNSNVGVHGLIAGSKCGHDIEIVMYLMPPSHLTLPNNQTLS